jgi:hypothetical protein
MDEGLWAKLQQSWPSQQSLSQGLGLDDQAAMQPETYANPLVKGLMSSLATLPQRAIQNSQQSLNTGNYDPGPTLEAATLPMGTGAIAGVPMRAGEAVLGAGPIRAYHGSPHDFDAFSMDKIGTGEGAQAYGNGLYFAENEGTAKSYRDTLSQDKDRILDNGGRLPPWVANTMESKNPIAIDDVRKTFQNRIAEAEEEAKTSSQPWLYPGKIQGLKDVAKAIEDHAGGVPLKPPGRMYEVNINADPEHFLDWDKPLSEQHPSVQQAFAHEASDKVGSEAYHGLQDALISNKIMPNAPSDVRLQTLQAQHLQQAGIPGIKYLDQGSRGAGEGSRNYVVFNHDLIDIMKKYGIAGLTPPAAAMSYNNLMQDKQQ